MSHTFIFPSQLKKPEEERIVSELKLADMSGDYPCIFKNVPHFVDEETNKLYIPNPVRVKMKELFKHNHHAEEIEMPSYDDILAEVQAVVNAQESKFKEEYPLTR